MGPKSPIPSLGQTTFAIHCWLRKNGKIQNLKGPYGLNLNDLRAPPTGQINLRIKLGSLATSC